MMVAREYPRVQSNGDHVCFNIGQDKFSRIAHNVTAHDVTFPDTAAKPVFPLLL
jgi:hypothetical protein